MMEAMFVFSVILLIHLYEKYRLQPLEAMRSATHEARPDPNTETLLREISDTYALKKPVERVFKSAPPETPIF